MAENSHKIFTCFHRTPGAPGAQTSSEKTAENLDLLLGSLGVSGSFGSRAQLGPAGLIHRLSTVNLLGGVWEFDNPP